MIVGEESTADGGPAPPDVLADNRTGTIMGQVKRFVLVGLGATGAHFLVLSAAVHIFQVASLTVATVIGTCVGIVVSYLGHHRFTFAAVGGHVPRFGMFVIVYGVVMTLHAGLMYVMGDTLGWTYAVPFIIATAFSAAVTFVLTRQVVFRPFS